MMRHEARLLARQMMKDPRQVEELRKRDLEKYGNPDGPSFQYLIRQGTKLGLKGDKIYEAIIEGSFHDERRCEPTVQDLNEWCLNGDRKEKLSK